MRADDRAMFRGFELEEPSLEVDDAVLDEARRGLVSASRNGSYQQAGSRNGPPGLLSMFGLLAAAAVLGLALTGFLAWEETRQEPHSANGGSDESVGSGVELSVSESGRPGEKIVGHGAPTEASSEAPADVVSEAVAGELRAVTGGLRVELLDMSRQAVAIPPENAELRTEIEARIERCLADLVAVERSLAALTE